MYKMFEFSAKIFAKNKVYNIIDGDVKQVLFKSKRPPNRNKQKEMFLLTDKGNESYDNQTYDNIICKRKFNDDDLESDDDDDNDDDGDDDSSNCGNSDKKGNLMIWKLLMMTKMMMRVLNMVMIFMMVWDLRTNLMITKINLRSTIATITQ